jgi:hypothetical protein
VPGTFPVLLAPHVALPVKGANREWAPLRKIRFLRVLFTFSGWTSPLH